MVSRAERYRRRKEKIAEIRKEPLATGLVDQKRVDALLGQSVDQEKLTQYRHSTELSFPKEADQKEVDQLLSDLRRSCHQQRLDEVLSSLKREVISSIAGPFGLGHAASALDKIGGNVTTVQNANNGVYAKKEDQYNRREYTHRKNSDGDQFAGVKKKDIRSKNKKESVGSKFTRSKMDQDGMVQDAYTGQTRKADTTSPDHIEPLAQYHKDGGFMQSSKKKADFATDTDNLALTERGINQSMGASEKEVWASKIAEDGTENHVYHKVDQKRLKEQVDKGKATSKKHAPSKAEKATYYAKNIASTGVNEGSKMGVQQAIGLLLVEFFSNSFIEIKQSFDHGLEGETLIQDVKTRLERIGKKCASKWQDLIKGFSGGFISGFISNLVTTLVNLFVTTSKRLVRMIREGVFSLLRAIKLILFPPSDMTYLESMHEAMKLFAAGGVVILGVGLEESVEKLVLTVPALAPFATVVTSVIVGSLTAISAALISYLIDKLDLLGALEIEQSKFVLRSLDESIEERLRRCEDLILIE